MASDESAYGPPRLGEQVDFIADHTHHRGTLCARSGACALVAVVGHGRMHIVPFTRCASVRPAPAPLS